MASHKVLKSVAHNVVHMFTGTQSYLGDDYAMGHVLRIARETQLPTLRLDLVTGNTEPAAFGVAPVSHVATAYSKGLRRQIEVEGAAWEFVRGATLTVTFDLKKRRWVLPFLRETHYKCVVEIVDDRGRVWSDEREGQWPG